MFSFKNEHEMNFYFRGLLIDLIFIAVICQVELWLEFTHAATLQSDDCAEQFVKRGKTSQAVFTLDSWPFHLDEIDSTNTVVRIYSTYGFNNNVDVSPEVKVGCF